MATKYPTDTRLLPLYALLVTTKRLAGNLPDTHEARKFRDLLRASLAMLHNVDHLLTTDDPAPDTDIDDLYL